MQINPAPVGAQYGRLTIVSGPQHAEIYVQTLRTRVGGIGLAEAVGVNP